MGVVSKDFLIKMRFTFFFLVIENHTLATVGMGIEKVKRILIKKSFETTHRYRLVSAPNIKSDPLCIVWGRYTRVMGRFWILFSAVSIKVAWARGRGKEGFCD